MEKYFDINADGCNIRCKLYTGSKDGSDRIIVFGHGFGGHRDNKAAERFADRILTKYKGTSLLTFDWPCHGSDVRKNLALTDCDAYLTNVLAYVREKLGAVEVYGYGTSFGGYLFLRYIADHGNPFRKLALRCPAISMYDVLTRVIMSGEDADRLLKGKTVPVGFDRKIKIGQPFLTELREADISALDFSAYAGDILLLHGTEDEVVPFDSSRIFAESNGLDFIAIENADHRFIDPRLMEQATEYILAFYEF